MFVLSNEGAGDIAEGRVLVDDASVDELPEPHKVVLLSQVVDPPAGPSERPEVLVYQVEHALRRGVLQRGFGCVEGLHVVTALAVVSHVALSCRCESLYRVLFALRHWPLLLPF